MKKMFKLFASLLVVLGLTSCGVNGSGNNDGGCTGEGCTGAGLSLDKVNEYLKKDPNWAQLNANGNPVTLIPFTHINGPGDEWSFFALVNYEWSDTLSIFKYQVTFLSCTCRSPNVNYWSTAYMIVDIPSSGEADDVVLKYLSFDYDETQHYLAGFWGDSGVNGNDINGSGMHYEALKEGFLPYLVGKTYGELKQLNKYYDINENEFNSWASTADNGNPIQVELLVPEETEILGTCTIDEFKTQFNYDKNITPEATDMDDYFKQKYPKDYNSEFPTNPEEKHPILKKTATFGKLVVQPLEFDGTRITKFVVKDKGNLIFTESKNVTYDMFYGSSVSTNNIIRVVNALLKYHSSNNI